MTFNSPQYLVFLPLVIFFYIALHRREARRDFVLLTASYAFYMAWNWKYAGLIAASTLLDYRLGLWMDRSTRPRSRRALLLVSLVMNLGVLGLFKYFNFFVEVSSDAVGQDLSAWRHDFLLPVGISFYTFQTLSYTIDLYRREIQAERSLLKFAVFVSFFPQLVAGPIVRAADFLPQLRRTPSVDQEQVLSGLWRIFRGLFKKVVIADLLAGLGVDAVFANPQEFSSLELLLGLYGYAFQIYNDFSGYSDIAIGTAALLGFNINENFKRPYLSQNVREFWTRWHISLSSWLRDYLYISLGGNRRRQGVNMMLTMLLGGLWHGAALNFVLWGAYHGVLLAFARGKNKHASASTWFGRARSRLVTFHLVLFGWLLFRVTSWANFSEFIEGLSRLTLVEGGHLALKPAFLGILGLGALIHFTPAEWIQTTARRFTALPQPIQAGAYAAMILLLGGLTIGSPAFIYFQF